MPVSSKLGDFELMNWQNCKIIYLFFFQKKEKFILLVKIIHQCPRLARGRGNFRSRSGYFLFWRKFTRMKKMSPKFKHKGNFSVSNSITEYLLTERKFSSIPKSNTVYDHFCLQSHTYAIYMFPTSKKMRLCTEVEEIAYSTHLTGPQK